MNKLAKSLNNLRSLRAAARDLTLKEMESVLGKVTQVTEEKRDEEAFVSAEANRKKERLEEYLELMAIDGISPSDLMGITTESVAKKPRKKSAPKYEWVEDGVHKTWTGQGRKPRYIQRSLDEGMELEQFAIGK